MSIQIWSFRSNSYKVLGCLSPVLKNAMDVPVKVTTGGLVLPDTKLILALGNESAAFLAGESIIPKNRTVHALRGLQFAYKDVPVFLSYSPDVGEINHKWEVDLLTDTAQMIRLYKTGSLKPKYGE